MNTPIRLLIDYASGEHWEMPASLYEKYTDSLPQYTNLYCPQQTLVQAWIASLSREEKNALVKK